MKWTFYIFLLLILFSISTFGQQSIGLIGGNIFDGEKFVKKDLFIVDGKITFKKPLDLGRTIGITSRYVIPPFGDAHTHNLDRKGQLPSLPEQYLKEGTFYIQNLTSKTDEIGYFKRYFSTKETPDVKFAHQGLTSTLGHPFMAYEPYTMGLNNYSKWQENMDKIKQSRLDENNSYIFIDSKKEAKEKLKGYFAQKPDVVKIFLTDVENFQQNSTDDIAGNSGLSPEVAKYIVRESHKRGLKVFAHIDTAKDFEVGVEIGVNGFAHIPNWDGKPANKKKFEVSEKIIKKTIAKNISIMPTIANLTGINKEDSEEYKNQIEFFREFLSKYHSFGGTVLIGSDFFNKTLSVELKAFIEVEAFNELELLKIVSEQTPRAIFPERKIGYLNEGFEGSVLVLEKNPLEDAENLFTIIYKIKQGHFIDVEKK